MFGSNSCDVMLHPELICQQDSNSNKISPFLEQRDICDFVNPEKKGGNTTPDKNDLLFSRGGLISRMSGEL